MKQFRLTRQALTDLSGIENHISQHSPAAALRVLDQLMATFQLLADNPGIGTAVDDIQRGLRYFTAGGAASRYVVLFRRAVDGVAITDVFHAAQDWQGMITRGDR